MKKYWGREKYQLRLKSIWGKKCLEVIESDTERNAMRLERNRGKEDGTRGIGEHGIILDGPVGCGEETRREISEWLVIIITRCVAMARRRRTFACVYIILCALNLTCGASGYEFVDRCHPAACARRTAHVT